MTRQLMAAMVAAALVTYASVAPAAEKKGAAAWTNNLQQARAVAKQTNRPILANFTGSDWCGYCIKQEAEVFGTQEFKEWAAKNVVLLTVDFPSSKALPANVKKQNDELKAKFKPRGFPTLVFMDAQGNEIGGDGQGRMGGYSPGSGFEAWKKRAEPILAKHNGGSSAK